MNQKLKSLPFNLTSQEVLAQLDPPLIDKDENGIRLLVFGSKVASKADVLYFKEDFLKVKSLSVDTGLDVELVDSLGLPTANYLLLADERGTANEQWLNFWETQGVALISDSKIGNSQAERIIYFDPMPFEEFSQIWGGAKFVKSNEQVVVELTKTESPNEATSDKNLSNLSNNFFIIPILALFFLFVIFSLIILFLKKNKKPNSQAQQPISPPQDNL